MCIFHEALSDPSGYPLSPAVVALSALQNGSKLFSEIATLLRSGATVEVSESAQILAQIAQDPYRYLRAMLSHEAERGHGSCALSTLRNELSQPPTPHFYDAVPCSPQTSALLAAGSTEELLGLVAVSGHSHRPAFLDWFRDNPAGSEAPQAIQILEGVAREMPGALSPVREVPGPAALELPQVQPGGHDPSPRCCGMQP